MRHQGGRLGSSLDVAFLPDPAPDECVRGYVETANRGSRERHRNIGGIFGMQSAYGREWVEAESRYAMAAKGFADGRFQLW
jgi:hypothetical protein